MHCKHVAGYWDAAESCVVWLTTQNTTRIRGGGCGASIRVPPENAGHWQCCTNQQQVRRHQQSRVTTHCSKPLNSRQQLQHVFSQNPFGQREAPPKCHTARLGELVKRQVSVVHPHHHNRLLSVHRSWANSNRTPLTAVVDL